MNATPVVSSFSPSKLRRLRAAATKRKLHESSQRLDPLNLIHCQLALLTNTVDTLVACLSGGHGACSSYCSEEKSGRKADRSEVVQEDTSCILQRPLDLVPRGISTGPLGLNAEHASQPASGDTHEVSETKESDDSSIGAAGADTPVTMQCFRDGMRAALEGACRTTATYLDQHASRLAALEERILQPLCPNAAVESEPEPAVVSRVLPDSFSPPLWNPWNFLQPEEAAVVSQCCHSSFRVVRCCTPLFGFDALHDSSGEDFIT